MQNCEWLLNHIDALYHLGFGVGSHPLACFDESGYFTQQPASQPNFLSLGYLNGSTVIHRSQNWYHGSVPFLRPLVLAAEFTGPPPRTAEWTPLGM